MGITDTTRTCRFETLEPRQMLAGNALVSAVLPLPGVGFPNLSTAVEESPSSSGSIHGRVHEGQSATCQLGDAGIPGVAIQLLDETGNLVLETQTDENGEYHFVGLQPGIYAVQQIQPEEYFEGSAHLGSGGGQRFSGNLLGEIIVAAGDALFDYDFCDHQTEPLDDLDGEGGRRIDAHALPPTSEPTQTNVFLELPLSPPRLSSGRALFAPSVIFTTLSPIPRAPFPAQIGNAQTDIRQLSFTEVERHVDPQSLNQPFSGDKIQWITPGFEMLVPAALREETSEALESEPVASLWGDLDSQEREAAEQGDWLLDLAGNLPWDPDQLWMSFGEGEDLLSTEAPGEFAEDHLLLRTAELP